MKRRRVLIIAVICLFLLISPALAADTTTYDLPDLNMTLDVPSDWIILTRDVADDDPNLSILGITANEIKDNFESQNIFISAICLEPFSEITVTMISDEGSQDVYDLNRISDKYMPEVAVSVKEEVQATMGDSVTYTDTGIYKHDQAKFMVFHFETNMDLPDSAQQYTTVINGQTINITLHSYKGAPTADQEQLLKDVVDSIHFTKITSKPYDIPKALIAGAKIGLTIGSVIAIMALFNRRKRKKAAAAAASCPYSGSMQGGGWPQQ